jgi:integrase
VVRSKIRTLHLSLSTEDAYCHWIGHYYNFCRPLTRELSPERKIEAFLTHLAGERKIAARTQNQAFSALLFLYKTVLGRPLGEVHALRAKRPIHERVAPSREQVRQLRSAIEDTPNTPARLLFDLLYGCGLRVSEPLELRVKDLLWGEGLSGHPREDIPVRYHLLSDALQRVVHKAATKLGLEGVVTPHTLRHAYATHSREPIDSLRQLLGHSSIQTTAGYLHPVVDQASNPLDDLLT